MLALFVIFVLSAGLIAMAFVASKLRAENVALEMLLRNIGGDLAYQTNKADGMTKIAQSELARSAKAEAALTKMVALVGRLVPIVKRLASSATVGAHQSDIDAVCEAFDDVIATMESK